MTEFNYDEYLQKSLEEARIKAQKNKEAYEKIMKNITFPEGITRSQESTLNSIIREIPHFDFYNNYEEYEVKNFEITVQPYGGLFVYFTTGTVGDEGTLAEALCRKHRTFSVGKKGGIQIMNSNFNFVSCSLFNLMNKHWDH